MSASIHHSPKSKTGVSAVALGVALAVATPFAVAPARAQQAQPAAAQPAMAAAPQQAAPDQGQADVRALLSNYGAFVSHPRYGEVWKPGVTPQGWRPYEPCNWVFTKKFGWYYQDPTPWGQIVHHFGRWSNDPQMGWIWVPGDEFSPAWVVWRTSKDNVGWAPTPPDEDIRQVSADQFGKPDNWIFVSAAKFGKSCAGAVPPPPDHAPAPYSAYAPIVAPVQEIPLLLQSTIFVEQVGYVDGIAFFILPPMFVGPFFDLNPWIDPWLGPWVPPLFGPWPAPFLNVFANELNWLFAAFGFGPPVPPPFPGAWPPGSPCNLPGVVCVPYSKKIAAQQKHPLPSLVLPPALVTPKPKPPVHGPAATLPPQPSPPPIVVLPPPHPMPPVATLPPSPPPHPMPPVTQPHVTPPYTGPRVTPPVATAPGPRIPIAKNPAYRPPLRPLPPTISPTAPPAQFHGIVHANAPARMVRNAAGPEAARAFPAQPMRAQVQPRATQPRPAWPVVR